MRIDSSGNLALMTDGAEFKLYYTEPRKFISNNGASVTIKQIDNDQSAAYIDFAAWDDSSLMRLMNSGNLLVSKSTTSVATAGVVISDTQGVRSTVDGNVPALLNRLTDDGNLIDLRKDGSPVGSIGTQNGTDFFITGSVAVATGLRFQTNEIVPVNGSAGNSDAAIDIGKSNIRFKDLYLSGGVNFDDNP
ncbi:MAG: hypothetical protein GY893_07265, partial [bacterium]|nr:hypothetical protein [bacterium]